ncbi:hypothetical protein ABPG72_006528 [Tetrahymena utriculariae]
MQQTSKKFQEVKKINDIPFQQVQNLFHRNRVFMMKHNIPVPQNKVNYKKQNINTDLTSDSLKKLRNLNKSLNIKIGDNIFGTDQAFGQNQNSSKSFLHFEDSQDYYKQKFNELLSTSESFSKHFVSSNQKMNKQIQIDYDKQKQRLMYGSLNQSKTLNSKNKSHNKLNHRNSPARQSSSQSFQHTNKNDLYEDHDQNEIEGQNYQPEYEQYKPTLQVFDRPNQISIHQDQILYPKSPSFNFDLYSQRKDLFKGSKTDTNSNEYRFNNFLVHKVDNRHTVDIQKQTNRKFEVFDCQMSEIKYDNVCEIYLKNIYSNTLTKCLVDYNREEKEAERVYYTIQKDVPKSDLEVANIIKGREVASPFKKSPSPNLKRSIGREKKINFYPNSVMCQPVSSIKQHKNERRYNSAMRNQNIQLQIEIQDEGLPINFNQINTTKRPESNKQRPQSREDKYKRVNTAQGFAIEQNQQPKLFNNKRNPLSLFREKRRKIHQMLDINE